MKRSISFFAASLLLLLVSCTKNETEPTTPKLIFKFKFDSTQVRLNNFGNPVTVLPVGHSALSPVFHQMSAHYIELAPDSLTPLGLGKILYKAAETTLGGASAIDFSKAVLVGNNETFFSVPIKDLTPGTYKWLRVSLAYQNYDIKVQYRTNLYNGGAPILADANVASFVGFNTYLTTLNVKGENLTINGNRLQGYGACKVFNLPGGMSYPAFDWQAPPGSTTVPNPIFNSSPIPQGSCVVTGRFASNGFTITGNETQDVVITVSLSTNKSFEWKDKNMDGRYEPVDGLNGNAPMDSVVDMGLRGLIPIVN